MDQDPGGPKPVDPDPQHWTTVLKIWIFKSDEFLT
jgi:hypothetical protein